MQRNLTKGPITVNLLLFALPLMFGNLLQQLYNVADTWVVGRYLGANALAAVGSSYTLMTFLTSIKGLMKDYLWVIFLGILATFLYNYFANLLRAIRNSMVPLLFLAVSSILNIILDLLFVLKFHWGVQGAAGVHYLRIEGACYVGIGILFLLYGYYRAVNKPLMSVILTIASLGTRVLLAYVLSAIPVIGVTGIWMSVLIGCFLADIIGIFYYFKSK